MRAARTTLRSKASTSSPRRQGEVACRPAFDLYAALCRGYPPRSRGHLLDPARAARGSGADASGMTRPVAYYAWSGHEQHANATQTARAISMLYALTGSFDAPGGNVLFPAVPSNPISGEDLPSAQRLPLPSARRAAARTGPLGQCHQRRPLPRHPRRKTLSGARPHRLRGQPPPGACRGAQGTRGPGRAGILRPCRPLHEPDGRDGRRRPSGRLVLRARRPEDRLRNQPRGAVAGSAAAAGGPAARRGALGHRNRLRPRRPPRARRFLLGRRHRGGLSPSARPVGRDARRNCGPSRGRAGHARDPPPQIRRGRRRREPARIRRRRHARSRSIRRPSSSTATHPCRNTRSR